LNLQPIDPRQYQSIDLDRLVIYAVGTIALQNVDLSYENIIVAAYKIFPDKFALLGFPDFPDSQRVFKSIWRAATDKRRLWLGGKVRQGFKLTEKGMEVFNETKAMISSPTYAKPQRTTRQLRKKQLLIEVLKSPIYSKYRGTQFEFITESELCFMLQGTLDSSRELLHNNLLLLITYAEELNMMDLVEFLSWIDTEYDLFFKTKL